jgi:hypothetical protein
VEGKRLKATLDAHPVALLEAVAAYRFAFTLAVDPLSILDLRTHGRHKVGIEAEDDAAVDAWP